MLKSFKKYSPGLKDLQGEFMFVCHDLNETTLTLLSQVHSFLVQNKRVYKFRHSDFLTELFRNAKT